MIFKKRRYLDWEDYKHKVDFLEVFMWQQSVRKQNMGAINF